MQIFAALNLYGRTNYVLIAHLILTIIDGIRSSRRARSVTLLVCICDLYTCESTRDECGKMREKEGEGEKERIGVQEPWVRDGEGGGVAGGEDSGGFSRRDGRCADITDK